MTLEKRLDALADDLTPRELVILWMREAHEFGDFGSYQLWLLSQPEEVQPLVRLPRHVYEGTMRRMRGRREEEIRGALRSRYRDLLFLFHLHAQLNERASAELASLRLRALLHGEQLQRLREQQTVEMELRELRQALGKPHRKKDSQTSTALQARLATWREEPENLWDQVRSYLDASALVSGHYFGGEKPFYPALELSLEDLLELVADEQMLFHLTFRHQARRRRPPAAKEEVVLDEYSAQGRALAAELVALAQATTFIALGERQAGIRLVRERARREPCRHLDSCAYPQEPVSNPVDVEGEFHARPNRVH